MRRKPSRSMSWTKGKLDFAKLSDFEPHLDKVKKVEISRGYGNTPEYLVYFKAGGCSTISKRIYDKLNITP